MDYGVEIHGANEAVLRFRAIAGLKDQVRDALQLAADVGADYMKTHVPFYEGAMYRAIFSMVGTDYLPGGAGGGGYYEARFGLDATQAPHAEHVIEGTGIFGPRRNIIRTTNDGPMRFEARGNIVFAQSTIGQPPQTEWFEDAIELALQVLEAELYGIEF
jgi:hypothetical protein